MLNGFNVTGQNLISTQHHTNITHSRITSRENIHLYLHTTENFSNIFIFATSDFFSEYETNWQESIFYFWTIKHLTGIMEGITRRLLVKKSLK